MYLKRGDKYWIFHGSEKNLIKNGAWVLEKSISLFHGKINPIRYFSTDELNHMNVEYECKLHGCFSMYQGSWQGRAVLVKLLDLPEKLSSEYFREVVGSLMGTHGNDHKIEWHTVEFLVNGSHCNFHQLMLCPPPEEKEEEKEELLELLREIVVGSQMGTHSNVHKLLGCCLETELPVLVYEWIEDETLEDRILLINKNQKKQPLEWKDRLRIAWEISHAIAYLHTAFPRPIIHTQLKSKTVFLDNNIAKLYNFGSSVSIPEGEEFVKLNVIHGTPGYMAPEFSSHVAESIDVYSFGMLFLMLLTAKKVSEKTHNSIGLKEWVQEGIKHKCISEIVDSAITRNGVTGIEELQLRASIHLALSCVVKEAYSRPTMVEVATELKSMITSPESIPSTSTFKGRNVHRIFNGSEENILQSKALVLSESFSLFHDRVPIRFFSVHELNTMNVEYDQIFRYWYQGSWEGRSVLVKLQNAVTIDSIETQMSILREILVAIQTATHDNVQKLLGCCLETKFPVFVYEWVAAETLEDRISPKGENQKMLPPLAWKDRLRIAWEISHIVSYLHTVPIIHGNLKLENIFLDQDGSVKLSNFNHFICNLGGDEFGVIDHRIETICGSMIPEYYEGYLVAECADVYSFGLLLLALLTGKNNASFPSTTTTEHKSTNLIQRVIKAVRMERISEIIDPAINENEVTTIELRACIDLALRCTTSLADCRPTMADVATELKCMICSHESIPCATSFQEKDIYRSFCGSKEYFMQNEALLLEKNISLFHDRANPIRYFSVDELNNMNIEYYSVFREDGIFEWYQGSWVGRVVWIKLPIRLFDKESLALSKYTRLSLLREVVITTQVAALNNVHKLLGCCLETKVPVLVYECMDADSTLENRILFKDENQNKHPPLEWKDRLRIALELSQVVSHLHKSLPKPIIHGLLRPRSVFLDQDNTVRLSNFSSSVSIPEGKKFVQNTFDNSFYMEPEYYEIREVGECTDVYSFGILFLVLLTGKSADFSQAEGHIRSTKLVDWVTEKFRKVCVSKIVDPAIAETGMYTAEMTASIKLALRCTAKRDKRPTMVDVATELEKIRSSDLPNSFSRLRVCFTS
ncbi:uncharacterized protein LOC110723022 [Chenopodium quinoa]|uniref:uncharacterized protein LOC110723022 n=1 Tax=Chenopodium quinoa TaxID=63459 RepID=UPI000B79AE4B|nr:uncharacterized protein LOC110723022 [Chenopodium quinoa]